MTKLGATERSPVSRLLTLAYGVACYALFLFSFLWAVGFIGGLAVPVTLDGTPTQGPWTSLLADVGLLAVFAVQHSVMARASFKRAWTKVVPRSIERSTYVAFSSLALALLCWQWRPIAGAVWQLEGAAATIATGVRWAGWGIVLLSTFMISHFDLFGLRQVYLHARGVDYRELPFTSRGFYALVRHPLQTGFLVVFWSTPTMTRGHLLFAVGCTLYILAALRLEERDLVAAFGSAYAEYRRRVPMLFPWPFGRGREPSAARPSAERAEER